MMTIRLEFCVPGLTERDQTFLKANDVYAREDRLLFNVTSEEHSNGILDYFLSSHRHPVRVEAVNLNLDSESFDTKTMVGAILEADSTVELDVDGIGNADPDYKPCRWFAPVTSPIYLQRAPRSRLFFAGGRIVVHESIFDFVSDDLVELVPVYVKKRLYTPYAEVRPKTVATLISLDFPLKRMKCRACGQKQFTIIDRCLFSGNVAPGHARLVNDSLKVGHLGMETVRIVIGAAIDSFKKRCGNDVRLRPVFRADSVAGVCFSKWKAAVESATKGARNGQ